MNWLKENWFKLILSILASVYVSAFVYEQYRLTKAHNVRVIEAIGQECTKYNEEGDELCAKIFKREFIPYWNPLK